MGNNRETITTMGTDIDVYTNDSLHTDYLSLTDIAKFKSPDTPADLIKNWMRSRSTIEYLGLWEQMYNPNFNNKQFEVLLSSSGSNSFLLSPTKWIRDTNAIGIVSKPGRYGGTYAQSDIAFEFASWVSVEFRLYLIKDYQQLKKDEASHLNLEWQVNRTLSKINYKIHTDAIQNKLIPNTISKQQAGYKYATEADRLNTALFGMTAKQWRNKNKNVKGNIRDNATLQQLTVLTNLESMNAELIKNNVNEYERTIRLNNMAKEQMSVLLKNTHNFKQLENLDRKN